MSALDFLLIYYTYLEYVYDDEFDMSPGERKRQERRARRKFHRVTSKAARGKSKKKKNEDVPSAIYLISKSVIPAVQRKDHRKQANRKGRKNKVKDAQAETGNDIDRKGADESKIIVADESSTVYSSSTESSEVSWIIPKNLMKVQEEEEAKKKEEQRRRDHDEFMKESMKRMKRMEQRRRDHEEFMKESMEKMKQSLSKLRGQIHFV